MRNCPITCEHAPYSVGQLSQPSLQEPPLRVRLRKAHGTLRGSPGLCVMPQSPAEVGSNGMRQVIVHEFAPGKNRS